MSITSALLAACSKGSDAKADTLYVGDQRGVSRVVLNAAGKLSGLPYKVEWATFPNAAPLLEALNAGAIDTGIGGDAAFIPAMASGAAIKTIGAQKYTGLGSVLVVRGDSSMRSLADMAGKTIATTRGSIAHNFVLATLEKQGRPFDAVRLAFMPPSDGLAALQSGAVDAWAVWDPNATVAAQGGARIIHAEGYVTSYTLLFASDGAISSKRLILQD
ncbi:ABC transporter substrate-binding protein [Sphingosinicellaceae bacterium]|nr:ABC transporter substrate-binding protein [Sphingosinicellaceae bacterium]